MITASLSAFKGIGKRKDNKNVYFCTRVPFLSEAFLNIYDLEFNLISKIKLEPEFFFGEFLCIDLINAPSDFAYLFLCDGKEYKDEYAEEFSFDKKYCIYRSLKIKAFVKAENIPLEEAYIYLAHVKGLTALDEKIKAKGTFLGIKEKAKYIKDLGFNTILLMPVYELKEDNLKPDYRLSEGNVKENYWGFGEAYHFALNKKYSFGDNPKAEFIDLINYLHSLNLQLFLMLQFEGKNSNYVCDVLKFYVSEYHIDGFRLLGDVDFKMLLKEPFLSNTKIMGSFYEAESFTYDRIKKNKNLLIMQDRFSLYARRFVKGDEDTVSYLSYAVREASKNYSPIRNVTDFSGFTLYDTVSYNVKHNENNLENNTDGTDYNYSWNCGEEGASKKRRVINLRNRQARNLLLTAALSQGTLMINAGDEILNTQFGNNNPYCQDNETAYVKWDLNGDQRRFKNFTKNLIAFKKRHSILHQPKELMLFDYMSCKCPDVSFHGEEAFKMDQTPVSRQFGILYFGDYSKQYTGKKEASVYIVFNSYWEDKEFVLPLKTDKKYRLLYSSDGSTDESFNEEAAKIIEGASYIAKPRSISVLLL